MLVRLALAFAAAHGVVHRVHHHTANHWTSSKPTGLPGLAEGHVLKVFVTDLAYRRHALLKDEAELTAGHTQVRVLAFLRHELCRSSGGTDEFRSSAGFELKVVHGGSHRRGGLGGLRRGHASLEPGPQVPGSCARREQEDR